MIRKFWRPVLWFGLLYFLSVLVLKGITFFFIHIPPKVVNLDAVILKLARVEAFMFWPWRLLLWLWSFCSESLPRGVNLILKLANSVVWGIILVCFREGWRRIRR